MRDWDTTGCQQNGLITPRTDLLLHVVPAANLWLCSVIARMHEGLLELATINRDTVLGEPLQWSLADEFDVESAMVSALKSIDQIKPFEGAAWK